MALQLSDLIAAVRGRHPAFEPRALPNASLARYLTGYQRELVSRALAKDRTFLAQQASVAFNVDAANVVGTAGAGTTGGLPVRVTSGTPAVVQAPTGAAAEADVSGDATVHHAESVVTSAGASTLSDSTASWTTNEHAGRVVVITGGTGAGQRRDIASNTATQVTATQAWVTRPDTTSTFVIVTEAIEDNQTFGVAAASPFLAERYGYLVRLTAAGVPYLDLTQPLVAKYATGIVLPPHHYLIGGTVRFSDDSACDLTLVSYGLRHRAEADYAAYVLGGELFLIGDGTDWTDVQSIDLRYVPVPPALTALADYLLLPETAYQSLVDGAAWHAAVRVSGLNAAGRVDPAPMLMAKRESEAAWLREISLQKRGRRSRLQEW